MTADAQGADPARARDARLELAGVSFRTGSRFGRAAPLDAGDVAGEASALATGSGLVPLLGLAAHGVSGGDARAFLHRMITQDVKGLAKGDARPALFLDVRGRVQGDPIVWDLGDRLLLVEEPSAAAKAIPALERYVIADDVTFVDESAAWAHFLVAGERSPATLDAARSGLAAAGAIVARVDLRSRPAFRVLAPAERAAAALDSLLAAGAMPAGEEALDVARVETLFPWFGAELDDRVLPNEAALDAAISWSKGCYLGQEPVVMAKHRGHPPSVLVALSVVETTCREAPRRDAPLFADPRAADAKPVGRVTTAVAQRSADGLSVLAYVRFERARVGEGLVLDDGRRAVVRAVAGA